MMPKLYMITVAGLEVKSDWRPVRARLLERFPEVDEVLATTIPGTILIAYAGAAKVDAWLRTVSDTVLGRRRSLDGGFAPAASQES
jgi:hypothetical protein